MIIGSRRDSASGPATGDGATLHPAVDLNADLDALQEERDFLIRSLKDLDAEREAGDIDEIDYQSLKDDYTARTASVLRTIEARKAPPRKKARADAVAAGSGSSAPSVASAMSDPPSADPSRRRWRLTAIVALILTFGALAGWGVTASSGSRLAGQTITGNKQAAGAGQSTAGIDSRILQANQLVNKGDLAGALKLYDAVLRDNPNQPEALANEGWLIAQAGMAANPVRTDLIDAGLAKIEAAERIDSSYAAAHFFRGFVLFRAKNDAKDAITELRLYLSAVDPSSPEVPQVQQLLQQAITAAGPDVPPGPNAPSQPGGPPAASPRTATSSP
jgi:tetratricopeptide (TPR) repeat protein